MACESPRSYTGLSEGAHAFAVRARDAAGNVDGSPATRTWSVGLQQGTDYRINATPERVVVNQSYENVRWSVANDGCLTDGEATLEHVATRTVADQEYDANEGDGLGSTARLYDWERMGEYRVYGEAWSDCAGEFGDTVPLEGDVIMVKRAARVTLDGNRNGRRVTLAAKVNRYAGGNPTWANHRGARVIFQQQTTSGWKQVASDRANRRGVATASLRSGRDRFRAVVLPTSTVWGQTSGDITR
jgi:hypothetical protein